MARSKRSQRSNSKSKVKPEASPEWVWVKVGPARHRLVKVGRPVEQEQLRTHAAQFRPLVLEHAEPGGSPVLHSAKEAKKYCESKGLISHMFS